MFQKTASFIVLQTVLIYYLVLKNQQTKKHLLAPNQKCAKIIKRSIQNNSNRNAEVVTRRCSVKKIVLKNFRKFTGKHLCWSILLNKVVNLRLYSKRGSNTGFSCEFCENFNNIFFRTSATSYFWKWMRSKEQLKSLEDLAVTQILTPSNCQHIMISINSTEKPGLQLQQK